MGKIEGFWWRALVFGLLFVIGYKIIDNIQGIFQYVDTILGIITPFIIGGIIAFFLHKPVAKIEGKLKANKYRFVAKHARSISLVIVYVLFFAACFFIIAYLVDAIYKNIAELIENWDSVSARAMQIFDGVNIPQKFEWLDKINKFLSNLMETEVLLKAGNIVGSVANSLVAVFTGLILSIYIIIEKESLKSLAKRFLKFVFKNKRVQAVNSYIGRVAALFYSYFTGLAIDAAVVGALSTIFYLIIGAPYAFLLGLVVILGNMIPFFGPIVATVIVCLVSAIGLGIIPALWILLFQIVLGQIDGNVIQPRIVGNSVGISPFWVIFAVLLFGGLWGTAGMILGVPIVAAVRMVSIGYQKDKATPPTEDA